MTPEPTRLALAPAKLTCAPALARIPTKWDVLKHLQESASPDHADLTTDVAQDWTAFVADVKERGVIVPLKVVLNADGESGVVWDGRHRLESALEAGLLTVPCEIITPEAALSIAESTMIARQHFTKGQRAYAAVALHPEAATASDEGKKSRTQCGITLPELAAKFGVSTRLIEQACELFRLLTGSKTLREKHEWRVFAGFGLGAVIAGIAGAEATAGEERPKAAVNIVRPIASLRTFWQHYAALETEQRDIMLEQGQTALAEGDPEFLAFLGELVSGAAQLAADGAGEDAGAGSDEEEGEDA